MECGNMKSDIPLAGKIMRYCVTVWLLLRPNMSVKQPCLLCNVHIGISPQEAMHKARASTFLEACSHFTALSLVPSAAVTMHDRAD